MPCEYIDIFYIKQNIINCLKNIHGVFKVLAQYSLYSN